MLKQLFSLPHMLFFGFAGVAGIGLLIIVHELGHFFFCKLFKVSTPTFSIGFGPKLISKKIGGTDFTLSAVPIGGYVEIAGLAEVGQGEQAHADRSDQYAFSSKPYYQKACILLGGITFNIIFTILAFCTIFWFGAPKTQLLAPINTTTTIQSVPLESSAYKAGLRQGDTIVALQNIPVKNKFGKLTQQLQEHPDKPITLTVERDSKQKNISIKKETILNKKNGSNITFELANQSGTSFIRALQKSIVSTWAWIKITINALLSPTSGSVGGPLSVFEASMKGAAQGIFIFLALLAIISINLAVLNLIPLPIADGGQLVIQTIESLIGRTLPTQLKEYIFMGSWLLFIALAFYLSAKDIIRMVNTYFSTLLHWLGIQ